MNERWQQVEKIFRDVMKRDPHDRAQFLDLVCANDPALRKEVEELVRSDEEAGKFLEVPVFAAGDSAPFESGPTVGRMPGQGANPEAAVVPGTQLGPYTIERLLGAGGMGHVF